jgi:hypothetical protein
MTNTAIPVQKAIWARVLGFSFAILDHGALLSKNSLEIKLYTLKMPLFTRQDPRDLLGCPKKRSPHQTPTQKISKSEYRNQQYLQSSMQLLPTCFA